MTPNRPNWFHAWLYPELKLFPSRESRKAAERLLTKFLLSNTGIWGRAIISLAVILIGWWWLQEKVFTHSLLGRLSTLPMIMAATVIASIKWIYPIHEIRHVLRRELKKLEFPTCMNCGYSLTGNTSGKCPECGTPILHTNECRKAEANL